MTVDSTRSSATRKALVSPPVRPEKPYADFPLTPHPSGLWQKKINGRTHYFGPWGKRVNGQLTILTTNGQPDGAWNKALQLYNAQKDALHTGRVPRIRQVGGVLLPADDRMTVKQLVNEFLLAKHNRYLRNALTARTFAELKDTCQRLVDVFGRDRPVGDLGPRDFTRLWNALPTTWGPVRRGNEVGRVKSVFAYAYENGELDRPMQFGSEFKRPEKDEIRKAKRGEKLFTADELRQVLGVADPVAKAMVLLGINAGYGNTDVATLPLASDPDREVVVDLEAGVLQFKRPKTAIMRRATLWPETIAALNVALAERPNPRARGSADVFFLTRHGRPFLTVATTTLVETGPDESIKVVASAAHPVTRLFGETLKAAKIKSNGRGFYTLRHTFRTTADAVPDRNAIDCIMGHANPTMGGHYTHGIADSRLKAVTDHVRAWLFPSPTGEKKEEGGAA